MNIDSVLTSDLKALAADTQRDLPTLGDTARALDQALARRASRARRPLWGRALVAGVALGVFVVPIPCRHTKGWTASVHRPDGGVVTIHLPASSEAEARRRARALERSLGASVDVIARTELVWGSVYAMARDRWFRVDVALEGKTDAEVEAEIRVQLEQQGWTPEHVAVERLDDSTVIQMRAADGVGRRLHIERRSDGAATDRLQIEPQAIDDEREPGMTDEQLRQKILRQLEERGFSAEVHVEGDRIQIHALRVAPDGR